MLDNAPNQPSKFKTKYRIEINDQSNEVYKTNSDIRFKNTTLRSSLCDYSDAYILVYGRTTITGAEANATEIPVDERNKGVTFKSCAPFTNWKSEISNTEIDNAKDIDIVMPMYNLIEYSDNYPKPSGSLWQYHKDGHNDNLADSKSFKSKLKITRSTPNNDNNKKDVKIFKQFLENSWNAIN